MSAPIVPSGQRAGDVLADRLADGPVDGGVGAWDRVLVAVAVAVALADVVFFLLIAEIIPPLAVGVVLTGVGIATMRRHRRIGLGVLGVTSVVMLVGTIPFAVDHIGHPESGVDWAHTVVAVLGRVVVLALVVVALRVRSGAAARLTGVIAVGVLGVIAMVALVATAVTSGDERQAGDVEVVVDSTAFPDRIVVERGGALFVDNTHIFRHTLTVEGTDIAVELPALQSVRIPVDLPSGSYEVICDVPGHDAMTSVLVVE